MAEIAVVIIDPEDERWAQLVEDQARVRDLLPGIVRDLELPDELNYELFIPKKNKALAASVTLAAAGVKAGGELLLKVVRDTLFLKLLDKLYDEAKDYVKDQLWDMAKDRLKAILRLDPEFPDPAGLQGALDSVVSAGQAIIDTAIIPPSASEKTAKQAVREPAQRRAAKPRPRRGISTGCVIAGVVAVGGVVVIGGIIAAVVFGWPYIRDLIALWGGDVVLGTGDVQVTLRWDTSADLDLHVLDPWGETIYHGNRESESGGDLDVDANRNCGTQSYNPVENIYWPTGGAPTGIYSVSVVDYRDCAETE
jgi:hypothetical protein